MTFSDANGQIGSAPVLNNGGTPQATFTTSALPVGNLTITATYGGDPNFTGSSISVPFTVQKQGDGTGMASSTGTMGTFGQTVTFTVTVVPAIAGTGPPTGTVTFTVNGSAVATPTLDSKDQVTFTTSTLPIGNDTVTASYNGDNNFAADSSSTIIVNVKDTTSIGLVSSQNPSRQNQPVTFTATVFGNHGGTPTGSVTFTDQTLNQSLGVFTLNSSGQATLTISTLAGTSQVIQASYGGDNTFEASATTLSHRANVVAKPERRQ